MSFQFIVINACEERKENMTKIFAELGVQDKYIHYLEASTPENSQEYFIDTSFDNLRKKNICCSRSHYRAIEYAAQNDSYDYSIILEDDAAFYKTDFFKIIEEIINNWEIHFTHCSYISLGWIPCNTYDHYKLKKCMKVQSVTDINDKFLFLDDFLNVGLQCYIVKKNKIKEIAHVLNKNSFNIFKKSVSDFMNKKYGYEFKDYSEESADHVLNRMMTYSIIFPPLVIEQKNIISLLGHENVRDYWNKFFKGYEEEIKNYITY